MSKVDDATVQFDFAGPWPGLIYNLSGGATGIIMRSPLRAECLSEAVPPRLQ